MGDQACAAVCGCVRAVRGRTGVWDTIGRFDQDPLRDISCWDPLHSHATALLLFCTGLRHHLSSPEKLPLV